MNTTVFVITAPHARCVPDATVRTCDLRAAQAATALHEALSEHALHGHAVLLLGDVFRRDLDLNRSAARDSPWREQLRKIVTTSHPEQNAIWVIDVHSFPDGSFTPGAQLVILNNRASQPEARVLHRALSTSMLRTVSLIGSELNDIQLEMQSLPLRAGQRLYSLLLEFNESMSDTDVRAYARAIAEAIHEPGRIGNDIGGHTCALL